MAYISGMWDQSRIICGNHPENEIHIMTLVSGNAGKLYYACNECGNRFSITDFEKMLDRIASMIIDADSAGVVFDPCSLKWTRNGIVHEVIHFENGQITVRILDRKSLAGRYR